MVEHDRQVGEMLDKLKALGLEENTIVMYSTDNGAEVFTWPDGGTTMFRGEKNTPYEGGYRVPCLMRWPGVIKPGTVINDIGAHEDMCATILAAAGEPDVAEKLKKGHKAMGRDYKVHLDSYNLMPALKGEAPWPRKEFLYWTDDGSVAALRYGNWKFSFLKQPAHGFHVWMQPFEELRAPMLTNLRMDPFELAQDIGMDYTRWFLEHMFMIAPAAARRRPVAAELPRVPAAAEAGQLQSRSRDGSGVEAALGRQLVIPADGSHVTAIGALSATSARLEEQPAVSGLTRGLRRRTSPLSRRWFGSPPAIRR